MWPVEINKTPVYVPCDIREHSIHSSIPAEQSPVATESFWAAKPLNDNSFLTYLYERVKKVRLQFLEQTGTLRVQNFAFTRNDRRRIFLLILFHE